MRNLIVTIVSYNKACNKIFINMFMNNEIYNKDKSQRIGHYDKTMSLLLQWRRQDWD